jgi:hypothetical protein
MVSFPKDCYIFVVLKDNNTMHRLEYEIELNETGRPCIDLPKDYEHKPEDRFFAIELTRYVLQDIYNRRSAEFDADAAKVIESGINLLGQVGDEVAEILWNQMKNLGDNDFLIKKRYHIMVETTQIRDELNTRYIHYNDRIYTRQEGLRVLVLDESNIYELQGGITNENWIKVE